MPQGWQPALYDLFEPEADPALVRRHEAWRAAMTGAGLR
jgi:hypothetical protein